MPDRPVLMISTCGTSLLTNGATDEVRRLLLNHANASKHELGEQDRLAIGQVATEKAAVLRETTPAQAKRLSAELNGLLSYHDVFPEARRSALHLLLISSTYQGELVGEILRDWLHEQGLQADVLALPDLVTKPLHRFQNGLCELVDYCARNLDRQANHVVFNVTGGFKSIQGFLQTLGMFYADECISIFESGELLRIPRIPARIDALDVFKENLLLFRELDLHDVDASRVAHLPETLFTVLNGQATFSGWGKLMWEQTKQTLYRQEILLPSSEKLRLAQRFLEDCRALPSQRVMQLNHRLDALARHLEHPQGRSLHSLDFKPIHFSPECHRIAPGATHEFDAWNDEGVKRGYGHFDGPVFLVTHLGEHL